MKPTKDKPVFARAVHPNAGVEAWYRTRLDAIIARMHASVSRGVVGLYAELAPPPGHAFDARRPPPTSLLLRRALNKWGGLWRDRINDLSLDLAERFARKNFTVTQAAVKSAFEAAGWTVKFTPTAKSVADYHAVVGENVNLIKSIPAQYLKGIETAVWDSVMRGGDMATLAKRLEKEHGITKRRAATIARDQNAKAKATIEQTRRTEMGVTHAVWMHSAGGKVPRKTHVAMDGKPYLIKRGMWDSDEGEYVLPGQLINCRCISKAVIPAFDNVREAVARARASRPTDLLNAARARAK